MKTAGYKVFLAKAKNDKRPLCCGRTFLASGLLDQAREEAQRLCDSLFPFAEQGMCIIGLEPSCLFTLRDELKLLLPGKKSDLISSKALLLEEFLAQGIDSGTFSLDLQPLSQKKALLHGHCHQKAFSAMEATEKILSKIPELSFTTIQSSCCGMAGAFGYEPENQAVSLAMGELNLFPIIRAADDKTLIVADGTSCRHQVYDGTQKQAVHVVRILEAALAN